MRLAVAKKALGVGVQYVLVVDKQMLQQVLVAKILHRELLGQGLLLCPTGTYDVQVKSLTVYWCMCWLLLWYYWLLFVLSVYGVAWILLASANVPRDNGMRTMEREGLRSMFAHPAVRRYCQSNSVHHAHPGSVLGQGG